MSVFRHPGRRRSPVALHRLRLRYSLSFVISRAEPIRRLLGGLGEQCSGCGGGAHERRDVGGGLDRWQRPGYQHFALDPPGIPHSGPDAESSIRNLKPLTKLRFLWGYASWSDCRLAGSKI